MKTQAKKIKEGYNISSDVEGRFFSTRTAAEKYIKRINRLIPADAAMKNEDIYRTTNEK
jgi:hypothetical protein